MQALKTTHMKAGESVDLSTLDGQLQATAMPFRGELVLMSNRVGEGQHVEVKGPSGSLRLIAVQANREHLVLGATQLAHGQTMLLETPMGTLAVQGWDPDHVEVEETAPGVEEPSAP